MNIFLKILLLSFLLSTKLSANPALSEDSLIRDAEVEDVIKSYIKPIFEVAKLNPNSLRLYVINSNVVNAFAMVLLTLLGAAGESLGFDRLLKSNTAKTRTHSLFRQGCMLFQLIPTMPDQRFHPLMERFAQFIGAEKAFNGLFQVV